MAKAFSNGLRRRVIEAIDRGLSRRQAAERFKVSAARAIRWLDRLRKQGDVAANRRGGDRKSGRIEAEAAFLLGEVAETPDITLIALQEKPRARGAGAGIGTLRRFFDRRRITFKKNDGRRRAAGARREALRQAREPARRGSRGSAILIRRG
jgi:transposase